ncbi:hypothetical protein BXA20_04765 [Corynebacterium diphtheriae]|nr:hypothetical protein BXA20_04765 [Corynebacterium diphtheriae]
MRRPFLQRRTSTTLCLMQGNEVRDHYWLLLIYREGLELLGRSEAKGELAFSIVDQHENVVSEVTEKPAHTDYFLT